MQGRGRAADAGAKENSWLRACSSATESNSITSVSCAHLQREAQNDVVWCGLGGLVF